MGKLRPDCGIWLDFDSDGRRHGKSGVGSKVTNGSGAFAQWHDPQIHLAS
jgi:hypothetical protein